MLEREASNEWLCMKREDGERGLKPLREVYKETRLHVGFYMFVLNNRWIKEAWKQETRKECNLIKDEIILKMQTKGKTQQFEGEDIKLKGKLLDRDFNPIWKQAKKNASKKLVKTKRLERYRKKEMQSEIYKKQDRKCNM